MSALAKLLMWDFVCVDDATGRTVFEWLGKDLVVIVVAQYHEIFVATARGCNKLVGLIGTGLPGWFKVCRVATVCAFGNQFRVNVVIFCCNGVQYFGTVLVFVALIHMSFCCGCSDRWALGECCSCKSRKSGENNAACANATSCLGVAFRLLAWYVLG